MSRLFFALWPDDETRERIAAVAGQLPQGAGRLISARNLHLTLVFLGTVEESVAAGLADAAAGILHPPATLVLDTGGWWKKPEVAWLGCSETPAAVSGLAQKLATLASGLGVPLETRPFKAHLTLARKVTRRPPDLKVPPIRWNVSEFCLVESDTRAGGSEYRVRHRWALRAA